MYKWRTLSFNFKRFYSLHASSIWCDTLFSFKRYSTSRPIKTFISYRYSCISKFYRNYYLQYIIKLKMIFFITLVLLAIYCCSQKSVQTKWLWIFSSSRKKSNLRGISCHLNLIQFLSVYAINFILLSVTNTLVYYRINRIKSVRCILVCVCTWYSYIKNWIQY